MTDLQNLRRLLKPDKNKEFNWENLTVAERWHYHAYDYAFLRSRGEPQDSGYALDPDGKWFNEGLVQAAERIYAAPPQPKTSVPRAEAEPDADLAVHFRQQDDERIPLKRQVQIHGERQANGEPTPEMEAFIACCVRQVAANEKLFVARNRRYFRRETQTTSKQVLAALGVKATARDRDVWFWGTMAPYIRRRLPDPQADALIAAWQIEDEEASRTVDALDRERQLREAAA